MHICYHNADYRQDPERTASEAAREISKGLEMLNGIKEPIIGVFGSHKTSPDDELYKHCAGTCHLLGEHGYGIITGGGPGIMEAANSGAKDNGTASIGIKAGLLSGEQMSADVHTHVMSCTFMFVRRFLLSINAHGLVFYPGGFGTLNELFEYVVLIQTKMLEPVPVICVGREFWQGMLDWVSSKLIETDMITDIDLDLIQVVDTAEEVLASLEAVQRE